MWLLFHVVLLGLSLVEVMSVGRNPVYEYVRPNTRARVTDDQAVLMGLSSLIASNSKDEASLGQRGRYFHVAPITTENSSTKTQSPDSFLTTPKSIRAYTRRHENSGVMKKPGLWRRAGTASAASEINTFRRPSHYRRRPTGIRNGYRRRKPMRQSILPMRQIVSGSPTHITNNPGILTPVRNHDYLSNWHNLYGKNIGSGGKKNITASDRKSVSVLEPPQSSISSSQSDLDTSTSQLRPTYVYTSRPSQNMPNKILTRQKSSKIYPQKIPSVHDMTSYHYSKSTNSSKTMKKNNARIESQTRTPVPRRITTPKQTPSFVTQKPTTTTKEIIISTTEATQRAGYSESEEREILESIQSIFQNSGTSSTDSKIDDENPRTNVFSGNNPTSDFKPSLPFPPSFNSGKPSSHFSSSDMIDYNINHNNQNHIQSEHATPQHGDLSLSESNHNRITQTHNQGNLNPGAFFPSHIKDNSGKPSNHFSTPDMIEYKNNHHGDLSLSEINHNPITKTHHHGNVNPGAFFSSHVNDNNIAVQVGQQLPVRNGDWGPEHREGGIILSDNQPHAATLISGNDVVVGRPSPLIQAPPSFMHVPQIEEIVTTTMLPRWNGDFNLYTERYHPMKYIRTTEIPGTEHSINKLQTQIETGSIPTILQTGTISNLLPNTRYAGPGLARYPPKPLIVQRNKKPQWSSVDRNDFTTSSSVDGSGEFMALSAMGLAAAFATYFLLWGSTGGAVVGRKFDDPIREAVHGARKGLNMLIKGLDEFEEHLDESDKNSTVNLKPQDDGLKEETRSPKIHNQQNITIAFNKILGTLLSYRLDSLKLNKNKYHDLVKEGNISIYNISDSTTEREMVTETDLTSGRTISTDAYDLEILTHNLNILNKNKYHDLVKEDSVSINNVTDSTTEREMVTETDLTSDMRISTDAYDLEILTHNLNIFRNQQEVHKNTSVMSYLPTSAVVTKASSSPINLYTSTTEIPSTIKELFRSEELLTTKVQPISKSSAVTQATTVEITETSHTKPQIYSTSSQTPELHLALKDEDILESLSALIRSLGREQKKKKKFEHHDTTLSVQKTTSINGVTHATIEKDVSEEDNGKQVISNRYFNSTLAGFRETAYETTTSHITTDKKLSSPFLQRVFINNRVHVLTPGSEQNIDNYRSSAFVNNVPLKPLTAVQITMSPELTS